MTETARKPPDRRPPIVGTEWFWFSFRGPRGALGGAWVYGEDFKDATVRLKRFDIIPRGKVEVKGASLGRGRPLPDGWKPYILYTPKEAEKTGRGAYTFPEDHPDPDDE